jgi:hypothetical protein
MGIADFRIEGHIGVAVGEEVVGELEHHRAHLQKEFAQSPHEILAIAEAPTGGGQQLGAGDRAAVRQAEAQ